MLHYSKQSALPEGRCCWAQWPVVLRGLSPGLGAGTAIAVDDELLPAQSKKLPRVV